MLRSLERVLEEVLMVLRFWVVFFYLAEPKITSDESQRMAVFTKREEALEFSTRSEWISSSGVLYPIKKVSIPHRYDSGKTFIIGG